MSNITIIDTNLTDGVQQQSAAISTRRMLALGAAAVAVPSLMAATSATHADTALLVDSRAFTLSGIATAIASQVATVPAASAAVSSPILDAARQIGVLYCQYEKADVPGAPLGVLDPIWTQIWALEAVILAATPATVTEAMVVLMVAAGSLEKASSSVYDGPVVDKAMCATTRATLCLAGAAHVSVEEFGGNLYLREGAALSCAGGVA